MTKGRAVTKYVRVSPRKARLVAGLIREKSVEEALLQLRFTTLKSGRLLAGTVNSAIANVESRFDVQRKDLVIEEVRIDGAPVVKRAKSKCRGGRVPILKRMSHFTVVVATRNDGGNGGNGGKG
ncbi:MAG: 50S ribosomal protein L22 [Simkaniaceae bacterium]|nr:50S ribosomal protein L22 [Simkaniaceae bacterium]